MDELGDIPEDEVLEIVKNLIEDGEVTEIKLSKQSDGKWTISAG